MNEKEIKLVGSMGMEVAVVLNRYAMSVPECNANITFVVISDILRRALLCADSKENAIKTLDGIYLRLMEYLLNTKEFNEKSDAEVDG